jgi:1-acyl-sn-glycerol-3-phosphate acyltransferase
MSTARNPFYPFAVVRFFIGYLTYFSTTSLFGLLFAPLFLLLTPLVKAKHRLVYVLLRGYMAFLSRWWLPALGLYRIVELPDSLPTGAAVYVANHRGFMDGPLLLGLLPPAGIIVKSNYIRWLVPDMVAPHFDCIQLDPNSPASVQAAVVRCRAVIAGGRNLLIFPEGTRARSGRLGRFKAVAFRIAVDTGAPVVPVIIHSTQPFMAKVPGSLFPRGRNVYRLRLLDPERVLPDDSADALSDRVYRRMARELQELDRGTFWEVGDHGTTRTI